MDASEKWIIWFKPHQTTILPKWMFFINIFFNSSLLLNGQCGIQVRPPNSSDGFSLNFCLFLLLCLILMNLCCLEIFSPISPSLGGPADRLELLDPTHRGLHRYTRSKIRRRKYFTKDGVAQRQHTSCNLSVTGSN